MHAAPWAPPLAPLAHLRRGRGRAAAGARWGWRRSREGRTRSRPGQAPGCRRAPAPAAGACGPWRAAPTRPAGSRSACSGSRSLSGSDPRNAGRRGEPAPRNGGSSDGGAGPHSEADAAGFPSAPPPGQSQDWSHVARLPAGARRGAGPTGVLKGPRQPRLSVRHLLVETPRPFPCHLRGRRPLTAPREHCGGETLLWGRDLSGTRAALSQRPTRL